MKHKHFDIIVAWAEGKVIQVLYKNEHWLDCLPNTSNVTPNFYTDVKYRIKPEPKPDTVRYFSIGRHGAVVIEQWQMVLTKPNIKATFDGETRLLKSVEMV